MKLARSGLVIKRCPSNVQITGAKTTCLCGLLVYTNERTRTYEETENPSI